MSDIKVTEFKSKGKEYCAVEIDATLKPELWGFDNEYWLIWRAVPKPETLSLPQGKWKIKGWFCSPKLTKFNNELYSYVQQWLIRHFEHTNPLILVKSKEQ